MAKGKPERIAERRYIVHARGRGALVRKMNGLGYMSWPDVLTIPPNGNEFFIEFKRQGEEPTELQADMHRQLRAHGMVVYVCYTFNEARAAYDLHAVKKNYRP